MWCPHPSINIWTHFMRGVPTLLKTSRDIFMWCSPQNDYLKAYVLCPIQISEHILMCSVPSLVETSEHIFMCGVPILFRTFEHIFICSVPTLFWTSEHIFMCDVPIIVWTSEQNFMYSIPTFLPHSLPSWNNSLAWKLTSLSLKDRASFDTVITERASKPASPPILCLWILRCVPNPVWTFFWFINFLFDARITW